MHAVFQGPPGTGKTDLARIWGKAAYVCEVTQTNLFVEVQGRDLVDKYADRRGSEKLNKLWSSCEYPGYSLDSTDTTANPDIHSEPRVRGCAFEH